MDGGPISAKSYMFSTPVSNSEEEQETTRDILGETDSKFLDLSGPAFDMSRHNDSNARMYSVYNA